ncbi:unnamed protein product [Rangifer tarandus platyrhynchus]|uniref:Uncharacterized protein n=1 Tax=Rangifer tarandus platyrhynchus TaxID=3082113 RepID=A0AC59Z5J2_RANTA
MGDERAVWMNRPELYSAANWRETSASPFLASGSCLDNDQTALVHATTILCPDKFQSLQSGLHPSRIAPSLDAVGRAVLLTVTSYVILCTKALRPHIIPLPHGP